MNRGLLTVMLLAALPAFGDTFRCRADRSTIYGLFSAQVSMTRDTQKGRVPGYLRLSLREPNRTLVSTDDRRRLSLDGSGEGVRFSLKLNRTEKRALLREADHSDELRSAYRFELSLDTELNDETLVDNDRVKGAISLLDREGDALLSVRATCTYDDASDE